MDPAGLGQNFAGLMHLADYEFTFRLGTVALVMILFDGGLNTPMSSLRQGLRPDELVHAQKHGAVEAREAAIDPLRLGDPLQAIDRARVAFGVGCGILAALAARAGDDAAKSRWARARRS